MLESPPGRTPFPGGGWPQRDAAPEGMRQRYPDGSGTQDGVTPAWREDAPAAPKLSLLKLPGILHVIWGML